MTELFPDLGKALHNLSIYFIPTFLGMVLHEMGHAVSALQQGDTTARDMGRITMNPFAHIDPVGMLMFLVTSLAGGVVFGWAKPVPVDPRRFRNPRRGLMIVALAGPLTNVLLALAFGALLKGTLVFFPPHFYQDSNVYEFTLLVLQTGILVNLSLALFNMLPIPPLDGSKVLAWFMPRSMAYRYLTSSMVGFVVIIVLVAAGMLGPIVGPILRDGFHLILRLFAVL